MASELKYSAPSSNEKCILGCVCFQNSPCNMKPRSRSIADCQDSSKQLANSLLSDLFFVTETLKLLFALVKFIFLWQK